MPGSGMVIKKEACGQTLALGRLVLTGVPITEATSTQIALGFEHAGFGGVIGLAALKRLDLVLDIKNGVAYLRPEATAPAAFTNTTGWELFFYLIVPRMI